MQEKKKEQDLAKYLKDIETIKDLLLEVEKKPLYENWAFYALGGLFILGTLVHFFTARYLNFGIRDLFLKIWLPVLLIGGFIEVITLVRNMSKYSLPLLSRSVIKLYLSLIGTVAVGIFVILLFINLNAIQYLPIIFLLFYSVFYLTLAQQAYYTHLYVHGYLFILLAIILYLFNIPHQILTLIIGSVMGVSSIIAGLTSSIMEKKGN